MKREDGLASFSAGDDSCSHFALCCVRFAECLHFTGDLDTAIVLMVEALLDVRSNKIGPKLSFELMLKYVGE